MNIIRKTQNDCTICNTAKAFQIYHSLIRIIGSNDAGDYFLIDLISVWVVEMWQFTLVRCVVIRRQDTCCAPCCKLYCGHWVSGQCWLTGRHHCRGRDECFCPGVRHQAEADFWEQNFVHYILSESTSSLSFKHQACKYVSDGWPDQQGCQLWLSQFENLYYLYEDLIDL